MSEERMSFLSQCMRSIKIRFFLLREWIWEIFYYLLRNPKVLFLDSLLVLTYLFVSPYRVVRKWDASHSQQIGPYGEIPLSQMEKLDLILLTGLSIYSFVDLGAGRGRIALWGSVRKGWKTCALECVPLFCKKLESLVRWFRIARLQVQESDWNSAVIGDADLVFINPGEIDEGDGHILCQKLSTLKKGAHVLCVGFRFPDEDHFFQLKGAMTLSCAWGEDTAYLIQRK